jgi:hypothetical protein
METSICTFEALEPGAVVRSQEKLGRGFRPGESFFCSGYHHFQIF